MDIQAIKARLKERKEDRVCTYVFCQQVDRDIPDLIAEVERLREALQKITDREIACGRTTPHNYTSLVIAQRALSGGK